jgi:hypothetical protein
MAKPNFTLPNKPAIKAGSILSYNYTDDFTFVPAPLTFNRDGAATRVNEKGLIEEVISSEPRIDYTDSLTEPSLLLEPQSTNLVTYSEDFSEWTIDSQSSIISNSIISPDGTLNATKLIAGSTNGRQAITINVNAFGNLAFSTYAKKGEYSVVQLTDAIDGTRYANFDLENGTLGSYNNCTPIIENVGNDWYRCAVIYTSSNIVKARISIAETTTQGRLVAFSGNGTDGIYIFGTQLEQLPYPTSYIPTQGATSTRLGETAVNAGDVNVFNSEEGVLYVNFKIVNQVSSFPGLRLQDDSVQNQVSFYVFNNTLQFYIKSNNVNTILSSSSVSENVEYKFAISYGYAETSVFLNGVKEHSFLNKNMPLSLKKINIETSSNVSKYKNIQVFNKALSDEELQKLTTI